MRLLCSVLPPQVSQDEAEVGQDSMKARCRPLLVQPLTDRESVSSTHVGQRQSGTITLKGQFTQKYRT